jgi:hypothetical protein
MWCYNDPYPRTVLIVPGNPERVVWIDFDIAINFGSGRRLQLVEDNETGFEKQLVEGLWSLAGELYS